MLDTPGDTHGGVVYVIDIDGRKLCFCGDLIVDGGHITRLWQMARSTECNPGYHMFMQSRSELIGSLGKLVARCQAIMPAVGGVINDITETVDLLAARVERIYRNYAVVSSLNHYFGDL